MRVTKTNGGSGGGGSGQIFILVNGVLTPIEIDTANPSNSVALPTTEFGRFIESSHLDASAAPINNASVTPLITTTEYANGIEVINTTVYPMQLTINGDPGPFIGSNGILRQAMALTAGSIIIPKTIQTGAIASDGIVAINTFA